MLVDKMTILRNMSCGCIYVIILLFPCRCAVIKCLSMIQQQFPAIFHISFNMGLTPLQLMDLAV